jgi:hypothetical protein
LPHKKKEEEMLRFSLFSSSLIPLSHFSLLEACWARIFVLVFLAFRWNLNNNFCCFHSAKNQSNFFCPCKLKSFFFLCWLTETIFRFSTPLAKGRTNESNKIFLNNANYSFSLQPLLLEYTLQRLLRRLFWRLSSLIFYFSEYTMHVNKTFRHITKLQEWKRGWIHVGMEEGMGTDGRLHPLWHGRS